MISFEMEDLIGVLQGLKIHFFIIACMIIVTVAICVRVKKKEEKVKRFVRSESLLAMILGIVVVLNCVLFGPMETLVTLATGSGQVKNATTELAKEAAISVAEEGFVLLKNDENMLPIKDTKKLNLFGWASTNPVYGGAGSGGMNTLFDVVSLEQGLADAGYELNHELHDFYTEYAANRAEVSITAQNWDLPEPPVALYTEQLIENAKDFSDTAVIVISRFAGEGHNDIPQDMTKATYNQNSSDYDDFSKGEHYLQLSQSEKNMVELVCDNFNDVLVVYNSAYTFELGFVEKYPQIKSVIWAPGPGNVGFTALGEIINGTVNPSGKTNDTFVYEIDEAPYYKNAVKTDYANMLEMTVEGMNAGVPTNYSPAFINYVENIYVGYKYYETASEDGVIDYESVVQYPFGYGMSYTSFEQKMTDLNVHESIISFEVSVKNTGDVAGKDVVEVYFKPPYENGGIEKASANLIAYEKTKTLQPGESQKLTISFDREEMASFDEKENGCYVLDSGEYEISINSNAHHVLDSKVYRIDKTIVYDENNPRLSDKVVATNKLQDAQGNVTYLSRADGFANYLDAVAEPDDLNMPEEYKAEYHLNANYDSNAYINPDDEMPTTGAENGLMLVDLRGKDYDDPDWEKLLDQLTIDEMANTIALSGYQTPAIASIGKVQNVDSDGPAAINNNFTGAGSIAFPVEVVIACTWSHDMATLWGEMMGQMLKEMHSTGWYAPAINTHRSAFTARNYEYFSEDGVLAGYMCADAVKGTMSKGVYCTVKHFAMYDSNGKMVCAWATEQSMREIYLKPFEIAVKKGNANAAMESWAFLGNKWVGEISELNNDILRDEWGFCGFVVSDFFRNNGHGFMNADIALANGVDAMLSTFEGGPNQVTDKTVASNVIYMRNAVHNILYTTVNSWAYDEEHQIVTSPTWKKIANGVDAILILLFIAAEVAIVKRYKEQDVIQ